MSTTGKMIVTPNLHFDGQCKKAIDLYVRAFQAEVKFLYQYKDANPADDALPQSQGELVYHAEIMIGGQRFMLSDGVPEAAPRGNSTSTVITFETAGEVMAAYRILSEGATIITAPHSTTYSSCFTSLVDAYGMRWELMTEQTER